MIEGVGLTTDRPRRRSNRTRLVRNAAASRLIRGVQRFELRSIAVRPIAC